MSSLVLFNTIPTGAIECILDEHSHPWFKRADLGRFLGVDNIKDTYRDVDTFSRKCLCSRGVSGAPLQQGQNCHDSFITLDGALEIAARSRKTKAVELIKWLAKKGVEKVVDDHKNVIEEKDCAIFLLNDDLSEAKNCIQALEYNNTGLYGEIRAKGQEIERRQGEIRDLRDNRHVPRKTSIDNILCFVDKQQEHEQHPYYVIRCQEKRLREHQKCLRIRYPDMQIIGECDDPNAVHRWCRFKEDVTKKHNFYRNHFNVSDEMRDLFETAFDLEI